MRILHFCNYADRVGGAEVYAISCAAPSFQLTAECLQNEIGPRLVALANNLAADLEGGPRGKG